MIKSSSTKFFLVLLILAGVLYAGLKIATAAFDIDTNIDTGNPLVGWLYLADYALIAISGIGLIVSLLVGLVRK